MSPLLALYRRLIQTWEELRTGFRTGYREEPPDEFAYAKAADDPAAPRSAQ